MQDQAQTAAAQAGAAIGTALAYTLITILAGAILFSIICAFMAHSRGRRAGLGFLGGFFFGLFAVIYYLIAGDSIEQRVEREEEARMKYREEHR